MAAADKAENTAAKWARPKAQHKLVIRWLRQSRCHLIFCIRAEEKVRLEKVYSERRQKEEVVVVPIGWQPICEKNTMYDMTTSFMLHPESPGVPHPIKLQEQHRAFFSPGQPVTRESGRMLAQWCAGGAQPPQVLQPLARDAAVEAAWEAARNGMVSLQAYWGGLPKARRVAIGVPLLAQLKEEAAAADEAVITADESQPSEPEFAK
jgi:hypothetical protein